VEKPIQALDAYVSLATTTARGIQFVVHYRVRNPWARRTRKA